MLPRWRTQICSSCASNRGRTLLAERGGTLGNNVTVHDATYVALAELLDAPLATLDRPLAAAPGRRCRCMTPR